MIKESKLIPEYDNAKSFYNKAKIIKEYNKDNTIKSYTLKSYNTKILKIKDNKIIMNKEKENYTKTTLRHIKELLKQKAYILKLNYSWLYEKDKITKADIMRLVDLSE